MTPKIRPGSVSGRQLERVNIRVNSETIVTGVCPDSPVGDGSNKR